MEILVCVHELPVDRDIQAAILSSPEWRVEEREFPIFFLLIAEYLAVFCDGLLSIDLLWGGGVICINGWAR